MSLNFTSTSSATIEVSAHSPSPILKAVRLSVKLPVAVELPALCVSATGTTTSRAVPLMVSLPAASNLPPPRPRNVVDTNVAFGNFAVLNHAALANSASVSAAPRLALPRSTVKFTWPACGCLGLKSICASNCRKRPSTGTPICLLVKAISLCAGTSLTTLLAAGVLVGVSARAVPAANRAINATTADPAISEGFQAGWVR